MSLPSQPAALGPLARLHAELAFLAFRVPRQLVQTLAQRLPLARLRDALPTWLSAQLRLGLYPARVEPAASVACARRHPPFGDPPTLDPTRPITYAEPPRVSILLVTYGNLDLTRLCLCSLQQSAGPLPFEILLIDNASPDETPAYLRTLQDTSLLPLRIVHNPKNLGFAAANNQAAALARGEWLVFLNNDTVVRPGWLEALVASLARDPSVGLVGPVTNSCGNEAQLGTPYADLEQMEHFAAAHCAQQRGHVSEPSMLTLFCAAMPAALFARIGGLDPAYGLGMFEDDDLSCAVRAAGKRLLLLHDVFVHHYGGAAFSSLPAEQYLRIFFHNRRTFEKKWRTRWRKR